MCYLQRLHSTIVQHTVWQLVFECVASPQKFLCYRTRGIVVGPQLASFVCVLDVGNNISLSLSLLA